jgi:hypothetical protein
MSTRAMNEERTSIHLHGGRRGRGFRLSATVAMAAGLVSISGPAVAQNLPRPGPLVRYEVSIHRPDGALLFDIRGTPNNPDTKGQFVSTGTVRFSPKLCEAAYRLRFRFTSTKGRVKSLPYPAQTRHGRLDGRAKKCPFDGLPRRGFKSMHVRATIDGKPLLTFVALPFTRSGDPFARLKAKDLVFRRPNTPAGLIHAWFRVQYASHQSHTVEFMADTNVSLPRGLLPGR